MPRLQILQHKSYHPYLESNKQKVREDEAKAAALIEAEERRMLDADSEARLDILRRRNGAFDDAESLIGPVASSSSSTLMPSEPSRLLSKHRKERDVEGRSSSKNDRKKLEFDWPTKPGKQGDAKSSRGKGKERDGERHDIEFELGGQKHINLWSGLEKEGALLPAGLSGQEKVKPTPDQIQDDDPTTMYLNRPLRETKPWYTDPELKRHEERSNDEKAVIRRDRDKRKDERAKSRQDPLTTVQSALSKASSTPAPQPFSKPTQSFRPPPPHFRHNNAVAAPSDPLEARLSRESAERQKARLLIEAARKKRERELASTPSTIGPSDAASEYGDIWNREELEEVRRRKEMRRSGVVGEARGGGWEDAGRDRRSWQPERRDRRDGGRGHWEV